MSTWGRSSHEEGGGREAGISAVLEAASGGCRNSNKVMVCQDVPVSERGTEGDGVGLCGR